MIENIQIKLNTDFRIASELSSKFNLSYPNYIKIYKIENWAEPEPWFYEFLGLTCNNCIFDRKYTYICITLIIYWISSQGTLN